jgi:aryl-alcohol dehydrogenase-like predicted oxidoreductase
MKLKQLGNSEIKISPLAFGAWAIGGWLWGGTDSDLAVEALETAIEHGMTSIDTAPAYGFGLSEELVAKAIQGKRDKVQLLTKFGLRWDAMTGQFFFDSKDTEGNTVSMYRYAGRESIIYECEQSLRRLRTDYIDLYQIHWADPTTPISETMETLSYLLKQGKIRAAGVCNYTAEQMEEAEKYVKLASNQVPYSMVNRGIEKTVIPWCIQHERGILAYSPLQRGLLSGKVASGHPFNDGDSRPSTPWFKEPNFGRINAFLDTLRPIAGDHRVSLAQLVLAWTLRQPGITCALAGARNASQVMENIQANECRLSEQELALISNLLNSLVIDTSI